MEDVLHAPHKASRSCLLYLRHALGNFSISERPKARSGSARPRFRVTVCFPYQSHLPSLNVELSQLPWSFYHLVPKPQI